MTTIMKKLEDLTDQACKLKGKVCEGNATAGDVDELIRNIWDVKACIGDGPVLRKKKKKKHLSR